jgi:hypothetical protein
MKTRAISVRIAFVSRAVRVFIRVQRLVPVGLVEGSFLSSARTLYCSDAGNESEVCPECRGLCGKANAEVTVFYPCQRCDGNGSVNKAKPQPNSIIEPNSVWSGGNIFEGFFEIILIWPTSNPSLISFQNPGVLAATAL